MISEWMKVMLEEISRKKAETEQARVEEQRRLDERCAAKTDGAVAPPRTGTDRARG
jgi:hypothetical protein